MAGLVHLAAGGTDVRLRKGAGTQHEVLDKLNERLRSKYDASSDAVDLRETAYGGRPWFLVLCMLAIATDMEGAMPMDAWCCAGCAPACNLTSRDSVQLWRDRLGDLKAAGIGMALEIMPSFPFGGPLFLRRDLVSASGAGCSAAAAGRQPDDVLRRHQGRRAALHTALGGNRGLAHSPARLDAAGQSGARPDSEGGRLPGAG